MGAYFTPNPAGRRLYIVAAALWSAVAERSGDTAFARPKVTRTIDSRCPRESGVALLRRFPPHSIRQQTRKVVVPCVRALTRASPSADKL